jgi:hypothetical protein
MHFCAKNAVLIGLLWVGSASIAVAGDALAGETGQGAIANRAVGTEGGGLRQTAQARVPLLGRADGVAILNLALDSHPRAGHTLDCSHFVHGMYERAGFSYPYASSLDLYQGIEEFRRVTTPQPGDLAVWRGHVGILVDPAERSFLSVLHAGASIDYYDSRYWKQRGHPRFYRYVRQRTSSGASDSVRRASLKADSQEADPREPATYSKAGSEEEYGSKENLAEDSPQSGLAQRQSQAAGINKSFGNSVAAQTTDSAVARQFIFRSGRPNAEEVRAAFLQASNDSEARLRGQDLFKFGQPVIVFDHFDVAKMHFSKNSGWIDVRLDGVMFIADGRVDGRSGAERQRWTLSRSRSNTWSLTPASNAIYLSQNAAERVVAHTLATLTDSGPESPAAKREKSQLSRLLNSLFEK